MNDRLHLVYQHDPNIVSRLIGGEMILVPIRQNVGDMEHIYTLNATAARIWELIDGKRSLAEIQQLVVQEFEIDDLQAQADLFDLVESLLEQGALLLV
ncbi:MAG: hypothetical protein A2Z16_07105 [Chloroflexi bacterium RBG_16_54_18]|nr:MAG: hypothetical protein A2Z16_07105 [Chloroflexi bacterium RBG_16_54_18]